MIFSLEIYFGFSEERGTIKKKKKKDKLAEGCGAGLGTEPRRSEWLSTARGSGKRREGRAGSRVPRRLAAAGTAPAQEPGPGGAGNTPRRPRRSRATKKPRERGKGRAGALGFEEAGGGQEASPGGPGADTHRPRGGERQAAVSGANQSRGGVESKARGHGGPKQASRGK